MRSSKITPISVILTLIVGCTDNSKKDDQGQKPDKTGKPTPQASPVPKNPFGDAPPEETGVGSRWAPLFQLKDAFPPELKSTVAGEPSWLLGETLYSKTTDEKLNTWEVIYTTPAGKNRFKVVILEYASPAVASAKFDAIREKCEHTAPVKALDVPAAARAIAVVFPPPEGASSPQAFVSAVAERWLYGFSRPDAGELDPSVVSAFVARCQETLVPKPSPAPGEPANVPPKEGH